MKSKLIKIYWKRDGGQFFINATGVNENEEFFNKSPQSDFGKVLSKGVTDAELGKAVREVLLNCD